MTKTSALGTPSHLPDGWRWERLGDLCKIAIGRTPRRDTPEYWGGDLPWVSIADLKGDVVSHTKERITQRGAIESGARIVRAGTLLFSFKLSIGKMAVAGTDLYTNEAIVALTSKHDDVDRDFLRFALKTVDVGEDSAHAVKGRTLNQESLVAINIPLPSLVEQRRIAAILGEQMAAVERARAAAEQQLEAAQALPSAYLRAVFESDEARTWPMVRLGDALILRKDVVHPYDNPSGRATFVGLEHVESVIGTRLGAIEVEMSLLTGRKPRFFQDDIVYGYLRPYLNKVWVADFDGLCSVDQYVYAVRTERTLPHFIAWFMRSPTFLARAPIATTPGQLPRIRTEEVFSVEIGLPSVTEQERVVSRIVEAIGLVNGVRRDVEEQLTALDGLTAGFLRGAFRGEL